MSDALNHGFEVDFGIQEWPPERSDGFAVTSSVDDDDTISSVRWVIHGNIIVPTSNPFRQKQEDCNTDEDSDDDDEARSQRNKYHSEDDADDRSDENNPYVKWIGHDYLKVLIDHVLVVDDHGIIVHLEHEGESRFFLTKYGNKSYYIRLFKNEFLSPGFIDLHVHAPQYAYTGTGTDRQLMGPNGWLEQYAFKAEESLKTNPLKAQKVYEAVVQATLQAGTTTACYYGTLHLEPCKTLVDIAIKEGQRSLIGKVCMDRNSPPSYCQTLEENLNETNELINYIYEKAGKRDFNNNSAILPLILPVVTPRFIPTCTPELMKALGDICLSHNCHLQSHISESLDEVRFSQQLDFAETNAKSIGRTDAEIFDSHGLLTDKSIMAHGVHLSENDLILIKRRWSSIVHCPLSNFYFAGGSLPVRKIIEKYNVKIGLGTDVAGGYSPSMMNCSRMAVIASLALQAQQVPNIEEPLGSNNRKNTNSIALSKAGSITMGDDTDGPHVIDYRHAFCLATLGGAEALGLENHIGVLKIGMEFDAIILSADVSSPVKIFDTDTIEDVFQKICTLGDDRNVKRVFVQGKEVLQRFWI